MEDEETKIIIYCVVFVVVLIIKIIYINAIYQRRLKRRQLISALLETIGIMGKTKNCTFTIYSSLFQREKTLPLFML